MRAVSLLAVFVLAKVLVLAGRDLPPSPWAPVAYLWQDAVVVLLFAAIEACAGSHHRIVWFAYAIAALYAAANPKATPQQPIVTIATPISAVTRKRVPGGASVERPGARGHASAKPIAENTAAARKSTSNPPRRTSSSPSVGAIACVVKST